VTALRTVAVLGVDGQDPVGGVLTDALDGRPVARPRAAAIDLADVAGRGLREVGDLFVADAGGAKRLDVTAHGCSSM
jgi:hypothetical protein